MKIIKGTRKRIQRIHGTILILIGMAFTINSTIGTYLGIGNFSFLQENEFALVGLFQAYLLMAIIGIATKDRRLCVIDETLYSLGEFDEVRLIIEMGPLRF